MEARFLRGRGEDQSRLGHDERLVRIFVLARSLERIAAVHDLAAQIAGLPRCAAEFFEAIEMRLKLFVRDSPILNRQIGGNCVLSVAFGEMAAQSEFGRKRPPSDAVPVRACAADTVADR